ncbi:MAG: type I-C CRISPR-associated endonuclease Cas1c [Cellulosilyticaceae bacterium]
MRKLLNTLYITQPEAYLSLDGENIVVKDDKKELGRVPLHNLEAVITMGYTGASPALMGKCAEYNIGLTFLKPSGQFLAKVTGKSYGNILLRKKQYQLSEHTEDRLEVSKSFIIGKVYNSRAVVERGIRDYALRLDVDELKNASDNLKRAINFAKGAIDVDQLRGYEGEAATCYFSVFDELILQQKDAFAFQGRTRRPPLDNVNALLSFCYSLLTSMCSSALETVGLDPYAGFMHTERPGRASLALDLMEELRPIMVDRFVLTLINKRLVNEKGFEHKENGAVIMDDDTRRTVLKLWQERKKDLITHPFLEDKIEWGLLPYAQALLLARFVRGDLDAYPPFFWK